MDAAVNEVGWFIPIHLPGSDCEAPALIAIAVFNGGGIPAKTTVTR
jgi:hypothetical protein